MDLKGKMAAALKAAQDAAKEARLVAAKATDEVPLTDEQRKEFQKHVDAAQASKAEYEGYRKDAEAMGLIDAIAAMGEPGPGGVQVGQSGYMSPGDRYVKADAYAQFKAAHPMGLGNGSPINLGRVKIGSMADLQLHRKAAAGLITSGIAHLPTIRMQTVDQTTMARLMLLDLITTGGSTDGDFDYVTITAVNRGAARVPEATSATDAAAVKPKSDLTTGLEEAKVYTYADGFDVTNKLLSRAPAFAAFMNTQLQYSLNNVLEDDLLSAPGGAGVPTGLEFMTGTQSVSATGDTALDKIIAIRKSITKLTKIGCTPSAVLMCAEDDEALDLALDVNDRFYGQGPFGTGPKTIWGYPRAVTSKLEEGEFWTGDWKQMELLDCEGLAVTAFNQHSDYAARNLVYVRGELSAAQVIWKPAFFCKVGNPGS